MDFEDEADLSPASNTTLTLSVDLGEVALREVLQPDKKRIDRMGSTQTSGYAFFKFLVVTRWFYF